MSKQFDISVKLLIASQDNDLDKVKDFLSKGADIHLFEDRALRCVAYHGHIELFKLLMENGADITINDFISVKSAVKNDHLEILNYLIADRNTAFPKATIEDIRNFNTEGSRYALKLIENRYLAKSLESSLSVKKEQSQKRMKI